MRTDTAKDSSGNLLAVVFHGQATDHFKADPVYQLFLELRQVSAEARNRKLFLRDFTDLMGGGEK